jgi:RNA polymerase sigma-70 factor (ECF subfamily)
MDATFLATLLEQHGPALALYARQWSAAPEDIVQEAFIKLAQLRSPPEPLVPWLYRVVRNGAISAHRSEERRKRHEARAARSQPTWFVAAEHAALDAAVIVEALQTLPPEQREVVTLHLWGGLTFAEIAQVMNCSASSAYRWYDTSLDTLRRRLSPCPQE